MVARNNKTSIRYRQFEGGYAQALDSQLRAVLTGYQRGLLRRNEVRVFAGRLEQAALHHSSKVTLHRIINCQSQRKGNRRMTDGEIQTAIETLDRTLPPLQQECATERPAGNKPVARRVLRHIARGSATTVEALFCFGPPQRINLTMNVYSHVNMEEQEAAIAVLPAPPAIGESKAKRR